MFQPIGSVADYLGISPCVRSKNTRLRQKYFGLRLVGGEGSKNQLMSSTLLFAIVALSVALNCCALGDVVIVKNQLFSGIRGFSYQPSWGSSGQTIWNPASFNISEVFALKNGEIPYFRFFLVQGGERLRVGEKILSESKFLPHLAVV